MDLLFIIVGFALIIYGANILTDGAAAAAKRLRVSEYIIGLTVVAVGTSMPELTVSLLSALDGNGTLAIGNVVGSNIFNTFVALGVCAIVSPVIYTRDNVRRDIPFGVLASVILMMVTFSGTIHRAVGFVMFLIYIALIYNSIVHSRRTMSAELSKSKSESEDEAGTIATWKIILMVVGGFAALIYGGDLLLDGAISFARRYGVSEKIISITLLAGGTSLPEFAATIIALIKGRGGIALGGIVGSNIANILLVLGFSGTLFPLSTGAITTFDFGVVLLSSLLLLLAAYIPPRRSISRFDGSIYVLLYILYMWYNLR